MAEYIKRQVAIDAVNRALDRETLLYSFVRKVVISALKGLPATNVVPVIHGKWERYMSFGICDKCGYEYDWKATDARNFCPNCGAKMERSEQDGSIL